MKTYILNCDPLPLARPRIGKHKKMYNTQQEYRLVNTIHLQRQHGEEPLFLGPLHLTITFFLKMPLLSPKKRLELENKLHHFKPDLSNLIKFVEDLANGIIYKDDSQISCITACKVYSQYPRTEFTISSLSKDYKPKDIPYENQKA